MKSVNMWRDVPVKIRRKMWHIRGINKRLRRAFCCIYGDVPIGSYNTKTEKFELCFNSRGNAYALRNALRNRKCKSRT